MLQKVLCSFRYSVLAPPLLHSGRTIGGPLLASTFFRPSLVYPSIFPHSSSSASWCQGRNLYKAGLALYRWSPVLVLTLSCRDMTPTGFTRQSQFQIIPLLCSSVSDSLASLNDVMHENRQPGCWHLVWKSGIVSMCFWDKP